MKISRTWLQTFFNDPLPSAEVLADALTLHAFEIDGIEEVPDDAILDVKVTPNRGHDCLSHRGIAKELAAILEYTLVSERDPLMRAPDLTPATGEITVTLDTPHAYRYIAAVIHGVKVGPSPDWLVRALTAMGQRSINNIVDATNFVMFSLGQPLHAFDLAKLRAVNDTRAIAVRAARAGETITVLDGTEYALTDTMLVITDAHADAPIGIAGIKGGKAAEIGDETTDIVIESANFDGASVRKTAQALKLRTDASARFEQVISPELAGYGMREAVELILSLAGGDCAGFGEAYPHPPERTPVTISSAQVCKLLGITVSSEEIARTFTRLGLTHTESEGVFEVTPPIERLDIEIAEDLIEEVARIIGYDRIPSEPLPPASVPASVNADLYAAEKAREALVAQGYSEVFTTVFTETGERAVMNKVGGDRPYVRDSLIPGLTQALAKNIPHKDLLGIREVKLFEIGSVWKGGTERVMLGTISEKQSATEEELRAEDAPAYDPLPLSAAARYETFSRFPYIVRDIALWVPEGTAVEDVRERIVTNAGPLLVSIRLFDTFAKEGRVSYAFRLVFQSFERTLTDSEVADAMQAVNDTLLAQQYEIR